MAFPKVLTLFGPTASGKTGAAIALAEKLNGEVINADSRQLYTNMPIVTAAPQAHEQKGIPHHLFEFLDPAERMSAAKWSEMAIEAIEDVLARNKTPILVGGTGLYLRTLIEGISEIPATPITAEEPFRNIPAPELHKQLQQVDPTLAEKLHPSDTQRLTRALAVHAFTGTPLSVWQQIPPKAPPYSFQKLALNPERESLYANIEKRWNLMLENGLLEEITALKEDGYTLDMPGLQGLGIPDLYDYLENGVTLEQASLSTIQGTRNYAKRQVTWLRNTYVPEHEFTSGSDLLATLS